MPLYLSHEDTTRLDLNLNEIIELFEEAHKKIGSGEGVYSPRLRLVYPPVSDRGSGRPWQQNLRILPGILSDIGAAVRVGGSRSRGRGGGGSFLLLFDFDTMTPEAIVSDYMIHGLRSGVPDGMAAKYLALENAASLGVIGSGRIACWGTRSVCAVRPIERIKVFSPTRGHRENFARSMGDELGVEVTSCDTAEAAVRETDIVVAATNTQTGPVLNGKWLRAGCAVIYNTPEEMDRETAIRARIVVGLRDEILAHVPPYDAIESLLASGDLSEDDLSCEMTDIVLGSRRGRTSEEEIVAYLNPGSGIYDVAVAAYVHRKAREQGVGTMLST